MDQTPYIADVSDETFGSAFETRRAADNPYGYQVVMIERRSVYETWAEAEEAIAGLPASR